MPTRKKFKKSGTQEKEMSLSGHLRELRNRLMVCLVLLLAAVLTGIYFAPQVVDFLLAIGRAYGYRFVYIAPQELLLQYFSVSLLLGICVTIPMLFYQAWAFIRPGLRKNENIFFLLAMIFGFICFGVGVYFAYRVMLPFVLHFLISLSGGSGVSASVTVQNYLTFLMTIFMIFGIVFELPVVSVLLNQMGLLSVKWMKAGRRVAIVATFVVAALITPPDIVSQIMVAIPMICLYELSIILCVACQFFRNRAH